MNGIRRRWMMIVFAALLLAQIVTAFNSQAWSDTKKTEDRDQPARRRDTGIAGSPNFTVLAPPGDYLADAVLENAERYRREIAKTWLGSELREGRELAHINVKLSDTKDRGVTWLCGPGKALPGDHRIWIKTSRRLALGATLRHEVAHVVLNSRFPNGMPVWAQEGIASSFDDKKTKEKRESLLRQFARENRWPSIGAVLNAKTILPSDKQSYTIAASLTEFLVGRGEKSHQVFLNFIDDATTHGWDASLNQHFGIGDVSELQKEWQGWARKTAAN